MSKTRLKQLWKEYHKSRNAGTDHWQGILEEINSIKSNMGYGNQRYNRNYRGGSGYSRGYNSRPKKKSGAKSGIQKTGKNQGKIYISAWKANKEHGLVTISAFENARSVRSESRNGNKFVTLMFEVFYKRTGSKVLELANYNLTTGKVYLEKLGWVISTKAPNGGYVGGIN